MGEINEITHDELVERARKWLRNKKKCSVVISEMTSGISEIPDAIGWRGTSCYLVEAKVNTNDYKADLKKFFRRYPEHGLASRRYYLVPQQLVNSIKKGLPPYWGLLSFEYGKIKEIVSAEMFNKTNKSGEIGVLLSVIKRIAQTSKPFEGANIRCYRHEGSKTSKAALEICRNKGEK